MWRVHGDIAGFCVELMKAKSRDSARRFLDDLERLPEMSKEELSERARRFARERIGLYSDAFDFLELS